LARLAENKLADPKAAPWLPLSWTECLKMHYGELITPGNGHRYYGTRSVGEPKAMPIRSFIQPGAFDPEVTAVMCEAYEAALKEVQDTGQPRVVPEVIASRIVAAARLGERDPVRLRESALHKPD
jgi:hypothetical protein